MKRLIAAALLLAAGTAHAFSFYTPTGAPAALSRADSSAMRAEFQAIAVGIQAAHDDAVAQSGANLIGTSTTSVTVGLGTQTFTTQSGKGWIVGGKMSVISAGTPTSYMYGTITSYTGTQLVINVSIIGAVATLADWNIAIAAIQSIPTTIPQGGTGATTVAGAQVALDVPGLNTANTFGAGNTNTFSGAVVFNGTTKVTDSNLQVLDNADPTKIIALEASGITTGTTRTFTAPDKSGTFALTSDLMGSAVRQTARTGVRASDGSANFLSAGAGLNFNVAATAAPLVMTFANGFSSSTATDYVGVISSDLTNQGTLAARSINYAYANYAVSTGAITWNSTKAPPQYGDTYSRTKASLLQFGGSAGSTSFIDDFGNTWNAQGGAKVQTNQVKFGTGALGGGGASNVLNGSTDYIVSTDFNAVTPPSTGWSLRGWIYPSTLPSAGNFGFALNLLNNTGSGKIGIGVFNNAGISNFLFLLSSAGGTGDIVNFVHVGTPSVSAGQYYFVEATYDALAGTYRFYVNGVQALSQASVLQVGGATGLYAGLGVFNTTIAGLPGGQGYWVGYIDKVEFLPYCDHPNGTTYSVPTGAPSIATAGYAQDWYDITAGKMNSPSAASATPGVNPTFTASPRLYVGEFDTNASAATAARNYAFNGRYDQTFSVTAVGTTKNHYLGVIPARSMVTENAVTQYLGQTLTPLSVTWTPAGTATARLVLERGW